MKNNLSTLLLLGTLLFLKDALSDNLVDITNIEPGVCGYFDWNDLKVAICHRTGDQIKIIKNSDPNELGDPEEYELIKSMSEFAPTHGFELTNFVYSMQEYVSNTPTRSLREDIFVSIMVSPYNGCAPTYRPDLAPGDLGFSWKGGFFNPCVGEGYDLAGRVIKSYVTNKLGNYWNLRIPPYKFVSDNKILLGELPENLKLKKYDFSPNLNSIFYSDQQRLFLATIWKNKKLVVDLINYGVNPNKVQISGIYPLHYAVIHRDYEMTAALLEHGADPSLKTLKGESAVDFAKYWKNEELIKLLESYQK